MTRKILIVGAGQCGLQLALSLLAEGYQVTVMSARTPEEIRTGRPMSTQGMFAPSLQLERDRGLNLWEDQTPNIEAVYATVADASGERTMSFAGPFDKPAQSVDQRVKMAGWLELFAQQGGRAVYHHVMTSELQDLAALYDLTIIAAGKGELVDLFDRDPARSPFGQPQRTLACIYLRGMTPRDDHPAPHVGINVFPGIGELFTIPAYTTTGPCDIVLWEAVPGGPLDGWDGLLAPGAHLERSLELMRQYAPWEYERCAHVEPTDTRCTLVGAYAPIVRHPIGRLSQNAIVLGAADVVVANDPICGQGANNAAHCAAIYLERILHHGDRPFDAAWMQATFDTYWQQQARYSTAFSNAFLGPLPAHIQRALGTATGNPAVARRLANTYAHPADFDTWLATPEATDAYLASVSPASPSDHPRHGHPASAS